MGRIEDEKPDLYVFLCEGGFSAQMNEVNTFGKIPIDQTLEETVIRETQTAGSTKGFSLIPSAVLRYYITAEHMSTYLSIEKQVGTPPK